MSKTNRNIDNGKKVRPNYICIEKRQSHETHPIPRSHFTCCKLRIPEQDTNHVTHEPDNPYP